MRHPLSFESKWLAISIPPLMAVLFLAAFSGCDTTPMKPGQGGVMAPPKPSMTPPPFPAKPGLTQAKPATSPADSARPATSATTAPKIASSSAGPLPLPNPPGKLPGPPGGETGPGKGSTNPDGAVASPVSKIEQAGNPVDLAADVLASGNNPFLNKLPKPKVAVISSDPGAPEPAPTDPFEGLTLQGILYGKNPMAMVAVSGDTGSASLVRPGDIVGAAKIVAIHPNGIEVADFSGQDRKTLSMPSIIGYGATTGAGSTAPSAGGNEETSSIPDESKNSGPPASDKGSSGKPSLHNIKTIVEKMAKDGVNPKLME